MSLNRKQRNENYVDIEDPIFSMSLHQKIYEPISGKNITRVPGGWIYEELDKEGFVSSSTFVPYVREKVKKE